MLNIIVGLCLLCLGISGVVLNWWAVVDFIRVIFPVALIIIGVLSMTAGIGKRRPARR